MMGDIKENIISRPLSARGRISTGTGTGKNGGNAGTPGELPKADSPALLFKAY
jgi:hypothetical protein